MKKNILLFVFILTNLIVFSQPGTLDSSFNPNDSFGSAGNFPYAAVLQSDGKIVIGGRFSFYNGYSKNRIIRLNPDASLDTSFNVGTGFSEFDSYVTELAIQPDGKFIVTGNFSLFNGVTANDIVRLNADGSLDTTFNFPVYLPPGSNFRSIIIQNDGKIVLGGSFNNSYQPGSSNFILRLNPNGSIDNSFSVGLGFDDSISKMIMQPDGKILIGGSFNTCNFVWSPCLIRLNEDGTIDTTFQIGNGFAYSDPYNGSVSDIDLLPNNSMLITGSFTTFDGVACDKVVKLFSNGSRDFTFDIDNSLTTDNYATTPITTVESNGKIVICDDGMYNGNYIWNVFRLNMDGSFDTTFTIGNGFSDKPTFSLLQPDGKLIFFGPFNTYNNTSRKYMARLNAGLLDVSEFVIDDCVVYPNPTNDQLQIQLSNNQTIDKIIITDISGKKVFETNEFSFQINVENLANGIYFIEVISAKKSYKTKFIKTIK